jgi:fluoride exporter
MDRLAWVCLGSALGGGARYLISQAALTLLGSSFPYGTLAVNVLGSFLIGLIMHVGLETALVSATTRIFLTTGLLGGLTTYSTFNYETLALASDGDWPRAALNVAATVAGCLAAGVLGLAAGRALMDGSFLSG